ncbi:MAG: hypothetical protein ACI4L7_02445 [Christensenellales bacterium]
MKNNKKLIIAITSLCLVVVAAVAAVVGILAATQVNVNSKLYVTYTPTAQVIATASASYAINGGTTTSINSATYNYGGTTTSTALDKTNIALDDTNTYVIFMFTFKNNAETANTNSKVLKITVPETPSATNMNVTTKYKKATSAPLASLTKTNFTNLADATDATAIQSIGIGETGYMYVMVEIQAGKQGSWGSASANTFAFQLSASAS